MATKLTKSFVDSIPLTSSGQAFYRDSELKGFGLRVGTTGKVNIAESKAKRKVVRISIGKHGVYTTEQARLQARELLLMMTKGVNPNGVNKEEKARGVTLGYIIIDAERLRIPMQKITDHLLKCMGVKPSAEIVDLVRFAPQSISPTDSGVMKQPRNQGIK